MIPLRRAHMAQLKHFLSLLLLICTSGYFRSSTVWVWVHPLSTTPPSSAPGPCCPTRLTPSTSTSCTKPTKLEQRGGLAKHYHEAYQHALLQATETRALRKPRTSSSDMHHAKLDTVTESARNRKSNEISYSYNGTHRACQQQCCRSRNY